MNDVKLLDLHEKIYCDERGWVTNPLEVVSLSRESLYCLHIASIKPGSIRGNHYHTNAIEWLLVCGGPAIVVWRSNDKSICNFFVDVDKPAMFEIPPQMEHAVLNTSEKDIYVLSFSNSEDRETIPCTSLFKPDNSID